jgi:hypothetical protein
LIDASTEDVGGVAQPESSMAARSAQNENRESRFMPASQKFGRWNTLNGVKKTGLAPRS